MPITLKNGPVENLDGFLDDFEVFPWNRNLETGHAAIDDQHKTLVNLLNTLARTLVNNQASEVKTAFDALTAYAGRHFDEEEALWAEFFRDDPWFASHRASHAAFLPKVIEIREREENSPLAAVIEQIVKFLIRWLAFHIIDNDKRMAIAANAVAQGMSVEAAKAVAEEKMSGSMRVLIETILAMYDDLSSRAIELMRERRARIEAEKKLRKANRRLEELAITDQLTGLFNRRYFDRVFDVEIRRARRDKAALTYMLIDIDYFKRFNDTYGHVEGDAALRRISECLADICRRPGDIVFRLGGEEFGILATGHPGDAPDALGEMVRAGVAALNIPHRHSDTCSSITVSVGLVNQVPSKSDRPETFYRLADQRLYQAKALGRNRVVAKDMS